MAHALGLDVFGQFAGDVTRSIVAEQPGPVVHMGGAAQGSDDPQDRWIGCGGLVATRSRVRQVERVGDVLRPHRAAQLRASVFHDKGMKHTDSSTIISEGNAFTL